MYSSCKASVGHGKGGLSEKRWGKITSAHFQNVEIDLLFISARKPVTALPEETTESDEERPEPSRQFCTNCFGEHSKHDRLGKSTFLLIAERLNILAEIRPFLGGRFLDNGFLSLNGHFQVWSHC